MKELYNYSEDPYYRNLSNPYFIYSDYLIKGTGTKKNKCLYLKSWLKENADFLRKNETKGSKTVINYRFFNNSYSLRESYGQEESDYFSQIEELLLSFLDKNKNIHNFVIFNEGQCVDKNYIRSKKRP